jgi:drug/metabolite transporter (DMT)-like permease
VGTYAYVNPVVAVALGHWLGGEELGMRTVVGTGLVLGSVVAIMMERKAEPVRQPVSEPAGQQVSE